MVLDLMGSTMVNLEWPLTVTRNGTMMVGTKLHDRVIFLVSARMESEAGMQSDWGWSGACLTVFPLKMGRLGPETFSTQSTSAI